MVYPETVAHPSTNRARRRVTTLIETNALPLSQATPWHTANLCRYRDTAKMAARTIKQLTISIECLLLIDRCFQKICLLTTELIDNRVRFSDAKKVHCWLTLADGRGVLSRQMVPRCTKTHLIDRVDVTVAPRTISRARVVATVTGTKLRQQRLRPWSSAVTDRIIRYVQLVFLRHLVWLNEHFQ